MGQTIRFLLDNNAPDSIRRFILADTPHWIVSVRDHLMHDATDEQITLTAIVDDLVIITHDRDFRRYLPQAEGQSGGVVRIRTSEPNARTRFAAAMDIVEFHVDDSRNRRTRPRRDLGNDYVTVHDIDPAEFQQVEAALRFHFERSRTEHYDFVSEISPRYWKFTERKRRKLAKPLG